ncbi:MAG: ATPase domain-containing protein [Candidatus Diapherotrites archaeon]
MPNKIIEPTQNDNPTATTSKKVEAKKVKTGVHGLDDILNGGIPVGNLVVVSGEPGAGKTIMCLEYLYRGITDFDEPGVYVSLEESPDDIVKTAAQFGWDMMPLVKKGKLAILTIELYDFDKLRNTIEDVVEKIGAKRLVIDPGVIFRLFFEKELDARKRILSLGKMLKKIGCTAIITNEISLDKMSSLFGLEEYIADGVILLYHTKLEDRFVRSAGILKMRGTKISEKLHPVRIDSDGLKILSKQELFQDIK